MPLNKPALQAAIYAAFRKQSVKQGPDKSGVCGQLAADISNAIRAFMLSGVVTIVWAGIGKGIAIAPWPGFFKTFYIPIGYGTGIIAPDGPVPPVASGPSAPTAPSPPVTPSKPSSSSSGGGGGGGGSSSVRSLTSQASTEEQKTVTAVEETEETVTTQTDPVVATEAEEGTVLVVIGGISYATSDWMLAQMPASIKSNRTILKYEHSTNRRNIINDLSKITYKKLELTAFSGGGNNAFKMLKEGLKPDFLGLIDPSIPSGYDSSGHASQANMPSGADTVFFYNHRNWNGDPGSFTLKNRTRLTNLGKILSAAGHIDDEVSTKHKKIPAEFFKKYMK
tara:strand:+ start:3140 stop:4150 length:1011 start_codon:yes stop_codon:yes gene_type:complete